MKNILEFILIINYIIHLKGEFNDYSVAGSTSSEWKWRWLTSK